MAELSEILSQSEFFTDLSQELMERIAVRIKTMAFPVGSVICHEGEPGCSMYIIVKGRVSVLKEMGWGQHELRQMGANEAFGEMALISKEVRSATVKALEPTECLQLDQESFSELLDQHPLFAQRVAKVMTRHLSALGERTSHELLGAYRALMFALADLTDSRDPETGAHLVRTRHYCVALAKKLAAHPQYNNDIYPDFIEQIFNVSPMHDIGKVAVPDVILLKPARLTPEEYEVMKTHAKAGAEAFDKVLEQCDIDIFRMARRICLYHHENWDGTGYPMKLRGDAIPLESRIMAMADVYDALLSRRVYKPALPYDATREEIRKSAGIKFDPVMTGIMLDNIGLFEEIHAKYRDL